MEKTKVTVNGQECDAFIHEGRTYVEVRKPFEAAGFMVNYNVATKQTTIVAPRTEIIPSGQERLLDCLKELGWGEVTIVVKNGTAVMVKQERKDIKLID